MIRLRIKIADVTYKAGINAFPDAIDYHLKCVSTPFKAR